jgi:hypothetical protein
MSDIDTTQSQGVRLDEGILAHPGLTLVALVGGHGKIIVVHEDTTQEELQAEDKKEITHD